MPEGWSSVAGTGSASWRIGTGDAQSATGTGSGMFNALITHTSRGNSTYLVSPVIDLSAAQQATLSFSFINRDWAGDIDSLYVLYRVNGGAWQMLYHTAEAHETWTSVTIPLAGLADNYQIAFKMCDDYGYGIGIDDVTIFEEIPSGWIVTDNITDNNYQLVNLDNGTTYIWQVRGNCGTTPSTWSPCQTFTTGCDILQTPYTETFENDNTFACWIPVSGVQRSTAATYQGGYALAFSGTNNDLIILPRVDQPYSECKITYYIRPSSYANSECGTFEIGYMTNPSDTNTFVPISTYQYNNWTGNSWIFKTEYFYSYIPNDNVVITFRHQGSAPWYVDYVTITEDDGCRIPNNLTAENITTNSAVLNWTARGEETSWNIYYKKSSESSYTTTTVTAKPYTLTGLEEGTSYIYYVKANCGTSLSDASDTISFTTSCQLVTIPYAESFEDNSTFFCWTPITGTATRYSTSSYNHTSGGSYSLQFASVSPRIVALPAFEQSISNLQLSFWTRPESYTNGYCGTFDVGYMTDLSDTSTFVVVNTYSYNDWTSDSYLLKTENFTGAPANAHIAFRNNANASYAYWYVDDVAVTEAPSCQMPQHLTATGVTAHSATLGWTAYNGESNWKLYYKKNMDAGYTEVSVTSNTYALTGLDAGTEYFFCVQAVCDSDNLSNPSAVCSFITECETYSLPYTYDFTDPGPYTCWTVVESDNNYRYDYYDHSPGGNGFCLYFYNTLMALPSFNQSINNLQLSFWTMSYCSGRNLEVGYITDLSDPATFVPVSTYNSSAWPTYTYYHITEYFNDAPAGAHIAIRSVDSWCIDDVEVTVSSSCRSPYQLTVADITSNSARLNWTARGSETAWNLCYKKVEDGSYTTISNVAAKPYTLTGLEANTEYQFYVTAVCGGSSISAPSEVASFLTECGIQTIPYSYDFETSGPLNCWNTVSGSACKIGYLTDLPDNHFLRTYKGVVTLPQFNQEISNLELTFQIRPYYYTYSYSGTFDVGYMTDPTDTSTFVVVNTYNYSDWTSGSFMQKVEYFTNAPTGACIALRTNGYSDDYRWYVDDVEVGVAPSCKVPNQLAATGITGSSATLNWTARGSETAWNLYYKKNTDSLYSVVNNVSNPYTLTGLESITEYQFYVTAVCGGSSISNPSDIASFFTGCGDQTTVPYNYDFETAAPLNCWNFISVPRYGRNDNNTLIHPNTSESPTYLWIYGSEGTVTLPHFNQEIRNLQLAFWLSPWNSYSYYGTFEVGYITSLNVDTATFVPVATYNAEEWSSTCLQQKIVYFDGAPDGSYIAFRVDCNSSYDWELDDVEVTMAPGCITAQPSVSNVTSTSATISWTPQGNHSSLNIYYKTSSDSAYTVVPNVTSNPYTLTGLCSGTSYECYLEGVCSGGSTSDPSPSIYFVTECGTNTVVPYYYDFEDVAPFYCWTLLAGEAYRNSVSSRNHTEGRNYSLEFSYINSYVAMPEFSTPTNTLQVSFWLQQPNEGNGTFSVGYMTNLADINTFVPVATYDYAEWDSTEYRQKVVQMTDAPAQSYIVFRKQGVTSTTNWVRWFLDDVEVTVIPVCEVPTNLMVTNIATESASLSWQSENGPWDIMLNETLIEGVTGTTYNFNNLTSNTTYQVKVRGFCEGIGESEWSEVVTFTTQAHVVPTYISFAGNTSVCEGGSTTITASSNVPGTYTWNSGTTGAQVTLTAGTYTVTITTSTGDQPSNSITIVSNPTYNVTDSRTICQSALPYTWNGKTFTNAGTQTVTLQTVAGCDSVVTMTLHVNPTYNVTDSRTICQSELPYTWNGKTFTAAGTQTATLQSVAGCDSVVTMTLLVNPTYNVTETRTICPVALPYTWNGKTFTAAGTQTVTLQTVAGCDSVVTMILSVNNAFNITEERSVCVSELPYVWNGKTFTNAGTQTATLQSVAGCDSVVTMTLHVNPTYNVTDSRTICQSELPYTWNGKTFTAAGTQTATLQTVNGCDSVVTMTLHVNPTYNVTDSRTVCQSALPYAWNGVTFTAAGIQTATLQSVTGCDSIVTMTLAVNTAYISSDSRTICQSELPYVWNGKTFTNAGTQTATLQSVAGCDSIVTMTLAVNPTYNVTDSRTVCQSELPYAWNGVTFTAAGTQTATLQTVNSCDSVVTMTLTVNPTYNVTDAMAVCQSELPYAWNGVTFTAAGTQTATLQTVNGCDSVVTMTLTVNPTYTVTESRTICQSELPYTWNGTTFTAAGTQTATLQTVNGCDSVVTMTLTVNPSPETTLYDTICEGEHYTQYGFDTIPGSYGTYQLQRVLASALGCDSTVTLTLTVGRTYLITEDATICDNDSYDWHGHIYVAAGVYYDSLQTVNGCDSVCVLTLTTTPSYEIHVLDTATRMHEYVGYGLTLMPVDTGVFEYEVQNYTINGCDSVIYLTLFVQNNTGIVDYDESIPEFTLFPNPAITYVNITGEQMEQVYVYNALGQLMMAVDAESDTHVHLEFHDYPAGQYVVKIKLTDGQTVQKKMIIRR